MSKKWVYRYSEVDQVESYANHDWDKVRALLGGKGANLADMTRLGVPVPPGFTVTTEACNAYLASGESFPEDLWEQELAALKDVETLTKKTFGDPKNPLLVSCRSGAKFSMPGMMDTILNIGLNDEVALGLIERKSEPRFVYDSYRRLVQMFGSVVLNVPDEVFEAVITARRRKAEVNTDAELSAQDWQTVTQKFKEIIKTYTGEAFPKEPLEQLKLATEAVFKSWNGKRARDYRNAAHIAHDLGTAVNIQTMVFGNMGDDCSTGVAMSRNASTGEPTLEGDYLVNAQGEDVVAGIRLTQAISDMQLDMPDIYAEFDAIAKRLEKHYRNMQDMEFTVEHGKLWILQTRDGKRTAQAEVRIAVDMVDEGLISKEEAVARVKPEQIEFFLHPQLESQAKQDAMLLAKGLNVSPGAAVGVIAFDADLAERWALEEGKDVIMLRPETKPDDVHGMLAAKGIVTSRGGRTSHAALVARQFGKPAVVGVAELDLDLDARELHVGDLVFKEGDYLSIDGTTGEIYAGKLDTVVPDISNAYLTKLLTWADEIKTLGVWANADYPQDAKRARSYGAKGLGLVRTEHMFFQTERLPIVQKMIMAKTPTERSEAIEKLLPMQRSDFEGIFREMDGLPVVIRLLDPPLHEFLPAYDELIQELGDLKVQVQHLQSMRDINRVLNEIRSKEDFLERVTSLREANPMLGTRGVRLSYMIPELSNMQVQAIFEAAIKISREGVSVIPKVMIPLVAHANELKHSIKNVKELAEKLLTDAKLDLPYKVGTMIEVPRAALVADELAETAEFFSFGTNDLTQTTFGISRDDAERGFLVKYLQDGILLNNPFETIDQAGVGELISLTKQLGRSARAELELGICGEHGGDPKSIAFCHDVGLNYVSCSPYRVPIARLAAAHAALANPVGQDSKRVEVGKICVNPKTLF